MASDRFKNATPGQRLRLGGMLLRSRYGAPLVGSVKELKPKQPK